MGFGISRVGKLKTYLSFVRFSHSVFALPFALTGALLAWSNQPFSWSQVVWIIVCMVSARSAAMGFNRLADARHERELLGERRLALAGRDHARDADERIAIERAEHDAL